MVKESLIKNWIQKKKAQRYARNLKDTRLLLSLQVDHFSQELNICDICSTGGSLLACVKCLKLCHLQCINLEALDLPYSEWPCSDCSSIYKENFIQQCEALVASQRLKKEKLVRRLKGSLRHVKKSKKLKKFKQNHPGLVKNGQILYPIDDFLLWSKPKLHGIQFSPFPAEMTTESFEMFSDLVQICDFLYNFKEIVSGPALTCFELFSCLDEKVENSANKTLHISLSKLLILTMVKSENFRKKGSMLNFLVVKTRKITSIDKLIEFSYLTFIENFFTTEVFKELIDEIDIETSHFFQNFSFVPDYFALSARFKVKLLVLFISLLLETRMFNEECNRRVEVQLRLTKELAECNSMLKQKKVAVDREELEKKVQFLKKNIKQVTVRTLPLGTDRNSREYFFFPWDPSKIFIKTYNLQNREHATWTFLSLSQVPELKTALNEKGSKESNLLQELEEVLKKSSKKDPSEVHDVEISSFQVFNDSTMRIWVRDLHMSIAENLGVPGSLPYMTSVIHSDLKTLIPLIINFHQAFTLRTVGGASSSFRQPLGLWDHSELFGVWESSLKECRNHSEVFLCLHLLDHLVQKFIINSKTPEISENAYLTARKSYKEQRLKVKKDLEKPQDSTCFLCDEGGFMVCCEKCPKAAHLRCAKLSKLPKGEWLCAHCASQANEIKLSRSQHIKY
jgi:hypothetical protein